MAGSKAPAKLPIGIEMALEERARRKNTHRCVWAIDYSINSKFPRLWIYDAVAGKMLKHIKCAHGDGGANAKPHDGKTREFSNTSGSHMSNLGFAITDKRYNGANGLSLRIKGLSPTNSRMLARAIVFHRSDYVKDGTTDISGRSWGCPAVDRRVNEWLIDTIEGGSVGCMHHNGKFLEGKV